MYKYFLVIIIFWLLTIIVLLTNQENMDDIFVLEVNRLHVNNTRETTTVAEVKIIDLSLASALEQQIFFSAADIEEKRFIILPIEGTSFFIRYSMIPQKPNYLPLILILSLIPISTIIILASMQVSILKPLKRLSEIPGQLAKGVLVFNTEQHRNKYLRKFIWGIDLLREKLSEQKNINRFLEKKQRTLIASLAHEIKSPLTSILNYSSAAKDGVYNTADEIHHAFNIIHEKADKIKLLTDELLDSSINAIETINVEISGHYLEDLAQIINKTIRNKIELLKMNYWIESITSNYLLYADIDRFIEVCDNIIDNAVKYGDLDKISVNFDSEEGYTLIAFENSGKQIPPAEIKHIFTSFYRGSNIGDASGHGLGLYIVKGIMQAMNGDVYLENTDIGVKIILVLKEI